MTMWSVIGGPAIEFDPPDGVMAWTWTIARGTEERTIRVFVADEVRGAATVSERSRLAASLAGRPAFEPYLEDDDPPAVYEIGVNGPHAVRP